MTTVGYGDIYPVTLFGRMIGVVCALWGTFIISLLIIVASEIFALSIIEQKALHHLLQTRKAAQSITNSMKYFISKQRYLESHNPGDSVIVPSKNAKGEDGKTLQSSNPSRSYSEGETDGLAFSRRHGSFNSDADASIFTDQEEGLTNFDDGVELTDVTKNYREMLASLDSFKTQK